MQILKQMSKANYNLKIKKERHQKKILAKKSVYKNVIDK